MMFYPIPTLRSITALPGILALCAVCTSEAFAVDLAWPDGSQRFLSDTRLVADYPIATGAYAASELPTENVSGTLIEEVWQVPGALGQTTQLFALLQSQVESQGYRIVYQCADRTCGGFDFRFGLPIADGPEMYVDLGDFVYFAAQRTGENGDQWIALTVSHGGQNGYAHVARVEPQNNIPVTQVTASSRVAETSGVGRDVDAGETLIPKLLALGSSPLDDLQFETGASSLSNARYESLTALAAFLLEDSTRRVVLVGHTDTEGSLQANIGLSEARADAVRAHLLEVYGIDPEQVTAEGIGYLAPRAVNTTAEGREANRRVEVVLLQN